MKKRKLALLGFAALTGIALASCGGGDNKNSGTSTGSGTGAGTSTTSQGEEINDPTNVVWNPVKYDDVKSSYNVDSTKSVDAWLVYEKNYGITYNKTKNGVKDDLNPITNKVLGDGELLPAWAAFQEKLGLTVSQSGTFSKDNNGNYTDLKEAWTTTDAGGYYKGTGNTVTDVFFNSTDNLNELGDADKMYDLKAAMEAGKMPALKKFLEDNPAVETEITASNGKIYFAPYLDGYQAIERMFVVDAEQIEKLLDDTYDKTTLGKIVAGKAATDAKGFVLPNGTKLTSYVAKDGKNYAADTQIDIVDPTTKKKTQVTVKSTNDIISQQNTLLNTTDGSCTGNALLDQFKAYIDAAYGDIITSKLGGKRSAIFTSVGACYNSDDMIALMRVFKACPDILYGDATNYEKVVPLFPRGQKGSRVATLLNFAATLYGVQGIGSEQGNLFIGADKKFHDAQTCQASYDMLDKLHDMYEEDLMEENFWSSSDGKESENSVKRYFYKNTDANDTYGLITYDYTATQSAANDLKDGVGTKPADRKGVFAGQSVQGVQSILSPLTYVATDSFTASQSLDTKTGKTLTRYYEENRSVKNTAWGVLSSSDNIDGSLALVDFMFTKEGWEIINFGPEGYWTYDTILGESMPKIKQEVLNHFSGSGKTWWNYCRGYLGNTWAIGHYRPTALDFQATNYYSKESYTNLTLACTEGVQLFSTCRANINNFDWKTSSPQSAFSKEPQEVSDKYIGLNKFWAVDSSIITTGSTVGWVAVVAKGKDSNDAVLTGVNNKDYKYADVKAEITQKNTTYLYNVGNAFGQDFIAPEAFTTN
jgi:hypothetical protein